MNNGQLVDLAIVIPTLNEEHYIGQLLDSIAEQSILPKEIVIVDAYSQDNTIKEIKKRQTKLPQLRYYQIPKYTISRQRNFGAQKTKAEHILFLDADGVLRDKSTLAKYLQEINTKKPDIGIAENLPLSEDVRDKIFFKSWHLLNKCMRYVWPTATAENMYVKREAFDKVQGFDEKIRIWEDCNLLQRVTKSGGELVFFKHPKKYTSVRRVMREGRIRYSFKAMQAIIQIMIYGYQDIRVRYEFGVFKDADSYYKLPVKDT